MNKLVVYVVIGKEERTCEYGGKHRVTLCTKKFLYPTGETWVHDNGYEYNVLPTFKDGQGRVWKKYVTIDYSNNVYYAHDDLIATTRLPYSGTLVKE